MSGPCLGDLRHDVDVIDAALLRLIYLRVRKAREAMAARGGEGRDPEREKEVVDRLWDRFASEDYGHALRREDLEAVWEALFSLVRGPRGSAGASAAILELTPPAPDAPEEYDERAEAELELDDEAAAEVEATIEEEEKEQGIRVSVVERADPAQMLLGDVDWGRIPKPPYAVPTVAAVRAAPKHGLTLISTFSGCGGSSLGFRMDGWNVLYASEFIEAARDSYLANFPETLVDPRDIRDVTAGDLLAKVGRSVGEVDVMEGSPPCASFSMAGKREKGWGQVKKYSDSEQRVDDLFFEYARLVQGVQPKVFVAENVPGLLIGTARSVMHQVMARMREAGYVVTGRVLNAADFGVPQRRRRLIFMGVRRDLADAGMRPAFPRPLGYQYALKEVLPGITYAIMDPRGQFTPEVFTDGVPPTILAGANIKVAGTPFVGCPSQEDAEVELACDISRYAIGKEWLKLTPGEQSERYFNLIRASLDEPVPTVTQTGGSLGAASVTHPTEQRKFTIPELRVICGFPLDFRLTGSYGQRYERLGRAVPPPLMRAVAEVIRTKVLWKVPCAE